jgi:hypothetical protein
MVILIIEVDDLDFGLVNPKSQSPVLRHEKAPDALSITGELMGLPAWHRSQFVLTLHVLKEGDHAAELQHDGSLKAGAVIMLDEAPKAFVLHVPYFHYLKEYRAIAEMQTVTLRLTPSLDFRV